MGKRLGRVKKTGRGFELIEFKDRYGVQCSLQQSSLWDGEHAPGASAVWLGVDANQFSQNGEPLSPRMHLDVNLARALIAVLQRWVDSGSFNGHADNPPATPPGGAGEGV